MMLPQIKIFGRDLLDLKTSGLRKGKSGTLKGVATSPGVVTDIGGPLSHGSIVAREYGIPAVLGTDSATSRIADGEIITVDGSEEMVLLQLQ